MLQPAKIESNWVMVESPRTRIVASNRRQRRMVGRVETVKPQIYQRQEKKQGIVQKVMAKARNFMRKVLG